MKMTKTFGFLLMSTLLFSSCITRLKVTTDVFDRGALIESYDYDRETLDDILELKIDNAKSLAHSNVVSILLDKCLKEYRAKTSSEDIFWPESQFEQAKVTLRDSFAARSIRASTKYRRALDLTLNLDENYDEILKLEHDADKIYSDFIDELMDNIESSESVDRGLRNHIELKIQDVAAQKGFPSKLHLHGESLLDDKHLSIITKAPNRYWRKHRNNHNISDPNAKHRYSKTVKSRYNKTRVVTFMGNSDIAIKMEEPGYFVTKGVRLDADEAIQASFKVLNQGIKYIALTSGVAVPEVGGQGGQPAVAPNTEAVQLKSKIEYYQDDYDEFRSDAAEKIEDALDAYNAEPAGTAGDAGRAAQMNIIKDTIKDLNRKLNKTIEE